MVTTSHPMPQEQLTSNCFMKHSGFFISVTKRSRSSKCENLAYILLVSVQSQKAFLPFRTNMEVEPEISEDGTEMVYRFRGFRGQYQVSVTTENQRLMLDQHLEVEEDSEFFIQLN